MIDRLARSPRLRHLAGKTRGMRRYTALRLVERPWRLRYADSVRLKGGGIVPLPQGTSPLEGLHELFVRKVYDPPRPLSPRRVLDLGGNVGLFALRASLLWPDAEIVCYEPDPSNFERLLAMRAVNGARWHLERAAAGNRDGEMRFAAGLGSGSHLDAGTANETITVKMVDILPRLASFDLAKIDIEGGEWAILTDPRLRECGPAALALEYHRHLCPARLADHTRPDPNARRLAVELLHGAGYETVPVEHHYWGHGTLWAFR